MLVVANKDIFNPKSFFESLLGQHLFHSKIKSKAATIKSPHPVIIHIFRETFNEFTAQNGESIRDTAPAASINPMYPPAGRFPIIFENIENMTFLPIAKLIDTRKNPMKNPGSQIYLYWKSIQQNHPIAPENKLTSIKVLSSTFPSRL